MIVDARGKPCPQPVVLALHALTQLKAGEDLDVLVDNEAAVQNLRRMAAQKGRSAAVQQEDNFWNVRIGEGAVPSVSANRPEEAPGCCAPMGAAAVVAVGTDTMGRGSEELGRALIKSFLPNVVKYLTHFSTFFLQIGVIIVDKLNQIVQSFILRMILLLRSHQIEILRRNV